MRAVDISEEVLHLGEAGVYGPRASEVVHSSIFDGLTEAEMGEMFHLEGDQRRVKAWLREGITWQVGDASDPQLVTILGLQDLVIANNFLCHMDAPSAEKCLRNLAQRRVRVGTLSCRASTWTFGRRLHSTSGGHRWQNSWTKSTMAMSWCEQTGPGSGGAWSRSIEGGPIGELGTRLFFGSRRGKQTSRANPARPPSASARRSPSPAAST